jgi:hypothetical protein
MYCYSYYIPPEEYALRNTMEAGTNIQSCDFANNYSRKLLQVSLSYLLLVLFSYTALALTRDVSYFGF